MQIINSNTVKALNYLNNDEKVSETLLVYFYEFISKPRYKYYGKQTLL